MKPIQIIEVKSEIGAGTRGASLGIDAIKIAALNKHSRFFKRNQSLVVEVENQLLLDDIDTPWAKRIEGLVKIYDRVAQATSQTLEAGKFPFVLAGDHSTAGGTIAGIKKAYPNKRLGAVWIDAHADLHSPYTTPSGNLHGMPVATALGIDNIEHRVEDRDLGPGTIEKWEMLKDTAGIKPKISAEDLVFVALRDFEEQEEAVIRKEGIRVFEVEEVRKEGVPEIVDEILKVLAPVDIIYISFDVDSMDKKISQGTGTPVDGGLEINEAKDLINGLLKSPKTVCFELVEVNPLLDLTGNKMAEIAFDIIKEAYHTIESRV